MSNAWTCPASRVSLLPLNSEEIWQEALMLLHLWGSQGLNLSDGLLLLLTLPCLFIIPLHYVALCPVAQHE